MPRGLQLRNAFQFLEVVQQRNGRSVFGNFTSQQFALELFEEWRFIIA
jgi:hypothetical protein